jgi:hypothetical protein
VFQQIQHPVGAGPIQKRAGNKGLIIGIITGAAVLIVVFVAVVLFFIRSGNMPDNTGKATENIRGKEQLDDLIDSGKSTTGAELEESQTIVTTGQSEFLPAIEKVAEMELTLPFFFGERKGNYTGELMDGVPHGFGNFTSVNPEGEPWYYEGEWQEGHFNGYGTTVFDQGFRESGEYTDDFLNGEGSESWQDYPIYQGSYSNGEYHGYGTLFDIHGTTIYSGDWENGYINETPENSMLRIEAFKQQCQPADAAAIKGACEGSYRLSASVSGVVAFVYEYDKAEDYYCDFIMYENGIEDINSMIMIEHRLSVDETVPEVGQTVTVWGATENFFYPQTESDEEIALPVINAWSVE